LFRKLVNLLLQLSHRYRRYKGCVRIGPVDSADKLQKTSEDMLNFGKKLRLYFQRALRPPVPSLIEQFSSSTLPDEPDNHRVLQVLPLTSI
jgi:hypothetical protein